MNKDVLVYYKLKVLSSMGSMVQTLIESHESSQQLWVPGDYSKEFGPVADFPTEALVALVYNTLTEEGLPHFHRLLAVYMGAESHWSDWTNLWTAEEDRHGAVLRDFLLLSGLVDMRAVDHMQYVFLRKGFNPSWGNNPYRLLAYTVLQEKATQVSHKNVAALVAKSHPTLAKVLGSIAREEGRHHLFYQTVFREVLKRDADDAVCALADVMCSFEMPGVNIPDFNKYVYVAERTKIFGTEEYLKIVRKVIEELSIEYVSLKSADAHDDRRRILALPQLLERKVARVQQKKKREMRFTFLGDTSLVL